MRGHLLGDVVSSDFDLTIARILPISPRYKHDTTKQRVVVHGIYTQVYITFTHHLLAPFISVSQQHVSTFFTQLKTKMTFFSSYAQGKVRTNKMSLSCSPVPSIWLFLVDKLGIEQVEQPMVYWTQVPFQNPNLPYQPPSVVCGFIHLFIKEQRKILRSFLWCREEGVMVLTSLPAPKKN